MVRKNGFIRNIKLILYSFFVSTNIGGSIPLAFLLYGIIIIYSWIGMAFLGFSMLMWIYLMCGVLTAAMTFQHYILYYRHIISFNSTRKNFYISSLAGMLFYAATSIILSMIIYKIIGVNFLDSFYKSAWLFVWTLFMGLFGALGGVIYHKSRGLGMVIFIFSFIMTLFILIIGTFEKCPECGLWHVMRMFPLDWRFTNIFVIICIAGSIVLAVVNWLIVRRIEIKA